MCACEINNRLSKLSCFLGLLLRLNSAIRNILIIQRNRLSIQPRPKSIYQMMDLCFVLIFDYRYNVVPYIVMQVPIQ